MGNHVAVFTDQQLEDYQDCSFLTRKQILTIFKRYRELDPKLIPQVMTGHESHTFSVSLSKIEKMPELKENPFKTQICKVFSHDGSGNMTFDDFLDMLSVFSENAPRDNKIYYAFRIYDYDNDHFIGRKDIEKIALALTNSLLSPKEIEVINEKVMEETDTDNDGKISFSEFFHAISRSAEFLKYAYKSFEALL